MSVRMMQHVWENGPDDKAELVVLLALADFANDDGECWPAMDTIGQKARMSERNARRVLRKLEADGYVETVEGRGRNRGNKYVIKSDKMSADKPDNMSDIDAKTGQNEHENRTKRVGKPDIAVSAEPSLTIIEPREEPPCIPQAAKTAEDKPEPKARLPANWALSDEGWAYARSKQIPDEDIRDEATGFHAYWTDRGEKKSQRGWEQCWQTRVRTIAGRYAARRSVAFQAGPIRHGQGSSLASIVARRRADGSV